MSIAVVFFTDSWCGLGAALKGGTLCGAQKVLNLIVYGLLVGSVAPERAGETRGASGEHREARSV